MTTNVFVITHGIAENVLSIVGCFFSKKFQTCLKPIYIVRMMLNWKHILSLSSEQNRMSIFLFNCMIWSSNWKFSQKAKLSAFFHDFSHYCLFGCGKSDRVVFTLEVPAMVIRELKTWTSRRWFINYMSRLTKKKQKKKKQCFVILA